MIVRLYPNLFALHRDEIYVANYVDLKNTLNVESHCFHAVM